MTPAIPWYQSPQFIGLGVTLITVIVALFPEFGIKFGLTPAAIDTLVTSAFTLIGAIAAAGVTLRVKSKIQPLTLTQSAADVHPNTLAAVRHPGVITAAPTLPLQKV